MSAPDSEFTTRTDLLVASPLLLITTHCQELDLRQKPMPGWGCASVQSREWLAATMMETPVSDLLC